MINAVPTAPGCVMATTIRLEIEQEDVSRIQREMGISHDLTPEDLTAWALGILDRHFAACPLPIPMAAPPATLSD